MGRVYRPAVARALRGWGIPLLREAHMFRKLCIAAAVAAALGSSAFAQVTTTPGRDATDARPLPGAGAMMGSGRVDRPIESTAGQTGGTSAADGSLSTGGATT